MPSPFCDSRAKKMPLKGLRVLDLTRVIAGPVATRALAGFGATVLRLDPSNWDEPGLFEDLTIGKSCAQLDLKSKSGRELFKELLKNAHVLVHGLRADALENWDIQSNNFVKSIQISSTLPTMLLAGRAPGKIDAALTAWFK